MRRWRTPEQDAWHLFWIDDMAMIPLFFLPDSSRASDLTRALLTLASFVVSRSPLAALECWRWVCQSLSATSMCCRNAFYSQRGSDVLGKLSPPVVRAA